MVTFSLSSAMNTVAMGDVLSQHGNLMVTFWTAVNMVITFELLLVINLLAMSETVYTAVTDVSFQNNNLIVAFFFTFWKTMSTVITFELLPVITLLVKSSTKVYTVTMIAFRKRKYLVRF